MKSRTSRFPSMSLSLVLSVVLVSSGCGKILGQKSDSVQPPRDTTLDDVKMLGLEDSSCQHSENVTSATVWEWNGRETVAKYVDFSGNAGSDGELISEGALGAIHSARTDQNCTYSDGKISCDSDTLKQTGKGTIVRICRADGDYSRDSIEAVTLNVQYYLGETLKRYKTLAGAKDLATTAVFPQMLEVMHVSLRDGSQKNLAIVDNAAMANLPSKPTLSFMQINPTSISSFERSPLNLWEVPFVIKHEYGHNVFFRHVGSTLSALGLRLNLYTHGLGIAGSRRDTRGSMSLSDLELKETTITGFNELFADLFAYYSNDGTKDQLRGVYGLDATRDPGSELTNGGNRKIWTQNAMDLFSGKIINYNDESEITFTGVHDVAAILGYPVAQLLDATRKGASSERKLEVLLKWLDRLASSAVRGQIDLTFDDIATLLVSTIVSERERAMSAEDLTSACAAFNKAIPSLPKAMAACR